jgi:lipopolysaccharide transport system ATP-binding protein
MPSIIKAENLSKCYLLGHRTGERERYTALRDVIARGTGTFFRKTADLFAGRQFIPGDEVAEFWALKDITFEVKQGEVLGILGRNGAGKSTLLKILSRITEPTCGRVRIKGRIASLLEVGTGFHPELTGRENIYLNGAILGMTRIEIKRKIDDIVAFAEVDKFLDTPVKRYSSGMYVRLAFAVAAHLEPEILAVDEVLAVGDAAFQKKCIGKMGDVALSGRTLLFVSHNMNAVQRLCQRVIWLEQGRLCGVYDNARDGILAYLASSGQSVPVNKWVNRGGECENDYFVPHRFEVSSRELTWRSGQMFSNSYPIELTVSGEVRRADTALNVGIGVYNGDDELLFWSFTTDEPEDRWSKLEPGPLRLRMLVPPRLLNEGTYRVELLASLHCRGWLIQPRRNGPSVNFSIQGGLSDSPYWDVQRPGIFAPVLRWENIDPEGLKN